MSTEIASIEQAIEKIGKKDFGIYFFTLDTKGNPTAGVANIYEHVKVLRELGYNAQILHDKNDYKLHADENGMGIAEWLGEEYAKLPHVSIEDQQLQVGPADFVVIPEAFASIMKQTVNFPCKRIVFLQSFEYVFEMLEIGENWNTFDINEVITTNENLKLYIESIFRNLSTEIIPVSIPEYFKPNEKPSIPTVSICSRDKREILKIVKVFFQKYPHYQFISFRDMSGLSREDFATELSKSFLSVWIDELASFGTFPIESMKCDVPVVGKIPRMVPEWMGKLDEKGNLNLNDNGVWTTNLNALPDIIATMVGLYLEDSFPTNILNNMEEYKSQYTQTDLVKNIESSYTNIFNRRIVELTTVKENAGREVENAPAQP